MSSVDNFFQSKAFRNIILAVLGVIILVLVFSLGIFVGGERAEFSFRWADEYHQNFGGPSQGFFGDFINQGSKFLNANGTFGQIIKIDPVNSEITIKDNSDNTEKEILVPANATITYQRKTMKLSDLKVDDSVIVIGDPNSAGQIQAKFIRVMPPKPSPVPTSLPVTNPGTDTIQ